MKAKHAGHCEICDEPIEVGSDISKLLGEYVHTPCKGREIERKRLLATVVHLPAARGSADRPQVVGVKSQRQAGISRIRQTQVKVQ